MNSGDPVAEPFQSPVPWQDSEADCLVIACSDHRFTEHIDAFVRHLGFQHAHCIRFPGGIVVGMKKGGLIVHADPDDYQTQPTGNAGARIAFVVTDLEETAASRRR